jgi:hypothetical protein
MCIINHPAHVRETLIFVAPDITNTKQITVYSNEVQTASPNNLMILPVPFPETVKFIDLTMYESIFKDLDLAFHVFTRSAGSAKSKLSVVSVGSYLVTLAMNIEDLDNLDQEVFGSVDPKIMDMLKKHYIGLIPFGFIICKLETGPEKKYHPFAYSHHMMRSSDKPVLFVPTRHAHGKGHTRIVDDVEMEDGWDHEIYSFNTGPGCGNRNQQRDLHLQYDLIPDFKFRPLPTVNKQVIVGSHPNDDYVFELL